MDGDLGAMLQSVLSDPTQMEKIAQMAKGLIDNMGQSEQPPPTAAEAAESIYPASGVMQENGDSRLVASLGKLFGEKQDKSRSTALLMAMRPYMRPEKQEKLDRAMQVAQMVHIAGAVMQAYNGGTRGL